MERWILNEQKGMVFDTKTDNEVLPSSVCIRLNRYEHIIQELQDEIQTRNELDAGADL